MKKIYTFILAMLFALPSFADETTIYLNTGTINWAADNAKIAIWYWGGDVTGAWSDFMTLTDLESDIYEATINLSSSEIEGVIFIRFDNTATSEDWSSYYHNRTGTEVPNGNNCFTVTAWNSTTDKDGNACCPGSWDTYTPPVYHTDPITIKAKCTDDTWGDLGIYWWDNYDSSVGPAPVVMTQIDDSDWYEYDISGYYGDDVSIIFTDGASWNDGALTQKTGNIAGVSSSKTYVIYDDDTDYAYNSFAVSELEITDRTMTFYYSYAGLDYQNLYVWQEKEGDTYDYKLTDIWPGDERDSEENYNEVLWNKLTLQNEFAENYTSKIAVIINDANGTTSASNQTDDIDILYYLYSDGWMHEYAEVWFYASSASSCEITFRAGLKNLFDDDDYRLAYNEGANPVFVDVDDNNSKTYSRASYSVYVEAYETAYETFAAYESTQTEIDDAINALEEAYGNLETIDYTEEKTYSSTTTANFFNSEAYNSLTLEAGAEVTVYGETEITINELIINSTVSASPVINISEVADIVANNITINKGIDNDYYYFFSLPFDVAVKDIVFTDGGGNPVTDSKYYGRDNEPDWVWVIREYSDEVRTTNWENTSAAECWPDVAYTGTLKANVGYMVGFNYAGTSFENDRENITTATLTFESKDTIILENLSSLDVTAYDLQSESNQSYIDLHKGYNLITVPSYGAYSNAISFTPTDGSSDGEIEFMSISEPATGGYAYTQVYTGTADFYITPFSPFFVQVPEDGTLNFTYPTYPLEDVPLGAPMLSAAATTASSEDYIVVNLMQDDEVVDRTTAIFVEEEMATYTNGYDLEKMFSTVIPQVYILDKGYDLAVNARQFKESDIITLEVYTPSAGEYTLSLESSNYMIEDTNTSEVSNTVTFTTEAAGYITGEYRVVRQLIATGNSCSGAGSDDLSIYSQNGSIVVENMTNNTPIYLYTATGQLVDIYKSEQSNITINGLNSGVYLLSVEGQSYKLIVNK